MSDDFHTFLEAIPTLALHGLGAGAMLSSGLEKAGILPFFQAGKQLPFCVMQPKAQHPELGPPPWQLCKGTRMVQPSGQSGWRDIAKGEGDKVVSGALKAEHLAATALREGNEELGLIAQSIIALFDLGPFDFTSASTGKTKQLWLYAAQLPDDSSGLLPMEQVAPSTAARRWCTEAEFARFGREDHLPIVTRCMPLLASHFTS